MNAEMTIDKGRVVAIRGSVVDVWFPVRLPLINTLLVAERSSEIGIDGRIVIEVHSHLDERQVRGIALTPAQGLARGAVVTNTEKTLEAPVDRDTLSHMFNVFGQVIDHSMATFNRYRSVHQLPPAL